MIYSNFDSFLNSFDGKKNQKLNEKKIKRQISEKFVAKRKELESEINGFFKVSLSENYLLYFDLPKSTYR